MAKPGFRTSAYAQLVDELDRDVERFAFVEAPVALVETVVRPERTAQESVVGCGRFDVAGRSKVPAEPLKTPGAESGAARVAVHQTDAGHDLVEVDDVHAAVDARLATVEEVATEFVAVDARRVDGPRFPPIPVGERRAAVDVTADLVKQVCVRILLVDPRRECEHWHREQ